MSNKPGQSAVAITPSDAAGIALTRGVYIGGAGNLRVDMADGTTVTFSGLAAGIVHPLAVKKVYATSTTATGVIGVY